MDILALQYLVWNLRERLHGDQRGQTAAEYLGIIVVVGLIIAAIAGSTIADDIVQGIVDQIAKIIGG